jgi:hypothetical protein
MGQLLYILGLTAPFVYASAVYGLFAFLERNASPAARRTLSDWIKGNPYTQQHVANIAVYVFDRIFTYPLLRWRPLVRTAILSIILTAIVVYTNWPPLYRLIWRAPTELGPHVAFFVFKNIISDYCSLFVVRRWLLMGANRPLLALITGPLVGALVVLLVFLVIDVTRYTVFDIGWFEWIYFVEGIDEYINTFHRHTANSVLRMPAFIIHLWLPLFAVGVMFAKGLNSLRFATTWTQWFLKNGTKRPFRAIGVVAAIVVFLAAALFRIFFVRS